LVDNTYDTDNYRYAAYRRSFRTKRIRRFPRIESFSWDKYFSAKNFRTSAEKRNLAEYKKNIRTVIKYIPKEHISNLKGLEVKNESHVSRGMANSKKIILNTGTIASENELMAVFIHEIGHVVDLGNLKGRHGKKTVFYDYKTPILSDDPSMKFYRISWKSANRRRLDSTKVDFVSGYAMSNPFEDFAEHYLFYRIHGEKFRKLAKKSENLDRKYHFFREYVFNEKEFQKEKTDENIVPEVIWDATLINFDVKALVANK